MGLPALVAALITSTIEVTLPSKSVQLDGDAADEYTSSTNFHYVLCTHTAALAVLPNYNSLEL